MADRKGHQTGRPSTRHRHSVAVGLLLAYGVVLLLLTLLNQVGGDRWWFGAFNHYLPQALWLIPLLPLAGLSVGCAGRWSWLLPVYALWILGPLMGFHYHRPDRPGAGTSLRVLTCNMKYGKREPQALFHDITLHHPDLVCLQDVIPDNRPMLASFFRGWHVKSEGQFWIASRFPLREPGRERMDKDSPYAMAQVFIKGKPWMIYSVHLLTPRDGLNALRPDQGRPDSLRSRIHDLQDNVAGRLVEARRLAGSIQKESGGVLVMGDLNSPDGSQVCRMIRQAGLRDAFAEAGQGYGYTYGHFLLSQRLPWFPHLSWMRIDHIMVSPGVGVQQCWTGTDKASDHRPVFADLRLP